MSDTTNTATNSVEGVTAVPAVVLKMQITNEDEQDSFSTKRFLPSSDRYNTFYFILFYYIL